VWLSRVVIHTSDDVAAFEEAWLRPIAYAALATLGRSVSVVIDGRRSELAGGATASYRLLSAIGLRRASPMATTCDDRDTATEILQALGQLIPHAESGLLIAAQKDEADGYVAGACILTPTALDGQSVPLYDLPVDTRRRYTDGFIDLLDTAHLALASRTRRPPP
jgi:hypothetical protein